MKSSKAAIGRVLVERRKRLGLTQKDVAAKSRISQGRIGQLERGTVVLHYWEVARLVFALGWSPSDFDRAYRHALEAPDAPPREQPYDLQSDAGELRDTPARTYDLTDVQPGSTLGIRRGRHLYVIEVKNVLDLTD